MDLGDYEDAWEFAAQNREDWDRGVHDDEEDGDDD
jgi:hypothetical protein